MRWIVAARVQGLFGYVDHDVQFHRLEPTIILGPNGVGKTHLLEIIRATLALDAEKLVQTSFAFMRVDFSDGRAVLARRERTESSGARVTISALIGGRTRGRDLIVTERDLDEFRASIPTHFKHLNGSTWLDSRTGRRHDKDLLEARYRVRLTYRWRGLEENFDLSELCADPTPVFIDTKRLDTAGREYASEWGAENSEAVSRIHEYTNRLRSEVVEARRSSVQATQSADLSFATRALAAARRSVNESDLHIRYDETVDRYEALARNGLAVGEAPIPFPERTTPTVRRILSVFLDDWDKRLEPLLPVNEKLQTLRDILDSKLAPSEKRTDMSVRGDLEFRSFSGRRIRVARLSSGEQHLVALFSMLLFSAKPGSLVLVDEPEISLHAAWKHAFLSDISRVAAISGLQVVLATHSSAIVNGRWDLTQELHLAPGNADRASEPDDENFDLDE